jgi:serine/threonine protein phosphatase PrpC
MVLRFLRRMWGAPGGQAEASSVEPDSGGDGDSPETGNVVRLGGAHLTISNAQDIGTREEQQDAFGISDASDPVFLSHGGVVAVVADGIGGLLEGGRASRAAALRFIEAYQEKEMEEPVGDALMRATREANQAVVDLARVEGILGNTGTTLVAAALVEGKLSWVSVGDSRLYLLRDGGLHRVTVDHNVATELEEMVAAGRMSAAEAQDYPDLAALTSFIGIEGLDVIDHNVRPLPLRDGDRLLLCSDGLDGPLSDDEISVLAGGDPSQAAESLVAGALSKGGAHQDNLTGVLLTFASDALPALDHGSQPVDFDPSQPPTEVIPSDEANDHA